MIYDCFTLFNELNLLELRLNILDEFVDTFVICEGDKTFRGKHKAFNFENEIHRFEKWHDKIVYLKCPMPQVDAWHMEEFQRNWISMGLGGARDGDLIFISDVDEIWDTRKLEQIERESFSKPVKLEQNLFYYYLNLKVDLKWYGTVALRMADYVTPQYHRTMGDEPHIRNAGWHFSYLGDANDIAAKIGAFSHSELDIPQFTNFDHINGCMKNGIDLFGRELDMRFVNIDESYPQYIRDHTEKYRRYLHA